MGAEKLFTKLEALIRPSAADSYAASITEWFDKTYGATCEAASAERGEIAGHLRARSHDGFITEEVGSCLDALMEVIDDLPPDRAAWVRKLVDTYKRERALTGEFIQRKTGVTTAARRAWAAARAESNFSLFASSLREAVSIMREEAQMRGAGDRRDDIYGVLVNLWEPGFPMDRLAVIFDGMRDFTVPLLQRIRDTGIKPNTSFLDGRFDPRDLLPLSLTLMRTLGFDMSRGGLDETTHPFCSRVTPSDVRSMTRFTEGFRSWFFGIVHEIGHALYEQGACGVSDWMSPDGVQVSLSIHESQSRTWENFVGRGSSFWEYFYPILCSHLPQFVDVPLDEFLRATNAVTPGCIRTNADEVTYNLHIIIRFELERALFNGDISVDDLPSEFNDRMDRYLGIRPPNAAQGILQDIQWSIGYFGYFPTYTLGNLFMAQVAERFAAENRYYVNEFRTGNFGILLEYLREMVHKTGYTDDIDGALRRITGSPLDPGYWRRYIMSRVGPVYGLS